MLFLEKESEGLDICRPPLCQTLLVNYRNFSKNKYPFVLYSPLSFHLHPFQGRSEEAQYRLGYCSGLCSNLATDANGEKKGSTVQSNR